MEHTDLKTKTAFASVGVTGKANINSTSARIDPSLAVFSDALYLNVGVEPTWGKETRSRSTDSKTQTNKTSSTIQYTLVSINPQLAYRLNPDFGIGLGYAHYHEEIDRPAEGPNNSISYGRFQMSAQFASAAWRFDLGAKTQAVKQRTATATNSTGGKNSVTDFRYLATEFSGKASYAVLDDLGAGLFLRYFAYDKKNNDVNPYHSLEIHPLDHISFGAQSAYQIAPMARMELSVLRKSALDPEQKAKSYVSANALELGATLQPYDATECGIRAGYAFGKDKRKIDTGSPSTAANSLTAESKGYSWGLWLARAF